LDSFRQTNGNTLSGSELQGLLKLPQNWTFLDFLKGAEEVGYIRLHDVQSLDMESLNFRVSLTGKHVKGVKKRKERQQPGQSKIMKTVDSLPTNSMS